MPLLRRHRPDDRGVAQGRAQVVAIARFWSWWRSGGAARALADPGELEGPVHAIDPRLAWEVVPGQGARHVLVVTSDGDATLRPVTRRWRRAAPRPDPTWSYSDTRLAAPDPAFAVLTLGGTAIDVASAAVRAQVTGASVDVDLYHPALARLPRQTRATAAVRLLDDALGEAAVETWVGSVQPVTHRPLDPVPLLGLRTVIQDLHTRYTDPDGTPAWVLLEGRTPAGSPVVASAQMPLRAATAPHLDTHVALTVAYSGRTATGLPVSGSLQPLRDFEDHVSDRLEESGRVVAHETHDGVRVLHLYVDGTTPAVEQLRAAVTGWDQGAVSLTVAPDPAWEGVGHLRSGYPT